MLVQGVPADGADESGVGTVRVGQRVSKVVQVSTAHWAVAVALNRVLFVTMTGAKVKERVLNRGREKGVVKKKKGHRSKLDTQHGTARQLVAVIATDKILMLRLIINEQISESISPNPIFD